MINNEFDFFEIIIFVYFLSIPKAPLQTLFFLTHFQTRPFYLESSTYEVFERDPVKYSQYLVAIQAAITDMVPDNQKDTKVDG